MENTIMALFSQYVTPAVIQQVTALAITLAYAMLLPILWLGFCLFLNRKHPHRAGFLVTAFFLGALAVMPTLPVEKFIATLSNNNTVLTVLWAASEELLKFAAFMFVGYRASRFNGPRDYPLAAITAGLGFAGLENALYILQPVLVQNVSAAALSGGMRFLGADLLHGFTMSAVGVALGYAYFKSRPKKVLYAIIGLAVGITVHSVFNLLVQNADPVQSFQRFGGLWFLALISVGFWFHLGAMEKPKFIQNVWSDSITDNEAAFAAFLAKYAIVPTDAAPVRDILKAKNIMPGAAAYEDLAKITVFLQKSYELHLRNQGLGKADSATATKALVSDSISPKTITFIFGILKQKQGVVLGVPQIEVFGKMEE